MARRSILQRARRAIANALAPELGKRGFDAMSASRFPREARMGRMSIETAQAAGMARARARYAFGNDPLMSAAVSAITTYAVGTGPLPALKASALGDEFAESFWSNCDADGRLDFGGLVALALLEVIVAGEVFCQFVPTSDGLKLRLLPAEQVATDESRALAGDNKIQNGIEYDGAGRVVAYWVHPYLPSSQFDTWAPPVRVLAADMLHIFKPIAVGQARGLSWLAPILLRLSDLGLLSDALLKAFQTSALFGVYLINRDGEPGFPFNGAQSGDAMNVSLEPGVSRVLGGNWDIHNNVPTQAQNAPDFLTAMVEQISAGLQVPAFMVSGNVSRANYSSLRASLLTFKASLEAIQYNILVPQFLNPVFRRWSEGEANPDWRFPAMPDADPYKAAQTNGLLLDKRLASRAELIAQRGESVERVDADFAADPHAQSATAEQAQQENQPEEESEHADA